MADDSVVISVGVVENRENPFTANGELSQKADYIISHSTITRTEVHIADPDAERKAAAGAAGDDQVDGVIVASTVQSSESAPRGDTQGAGDAIGTTPVEVEVSKGSAAPAQPQHAEEVKLKEKQNCCAIL